MGKSETARRWTVVGAAAAICITGAGAGAWVVLASEETAAKTADLPPGPLPVVRAAAAVDAKAADWRIVSVFEGEAVLATDHDLVRVKVGSTLSGVGTVTGIQSDATGGGTVSGTEAVLRTL